MGLGYLSVLVLVVAPQWKQVISILLDPKTAASGTDGAAVRRGKSIECFLNNNYFDRLIVNFKIDTKYKFIELVSENFLFFILFSTNLNSLNV
jgi:hypothetical protein